MTLNNRGRERVSDRKTAAPTWYVYILEKTDGSYYIGQTNDLHTRLAEHEVGGGAKVTAKGGNRLVWFNQTHDRDSALKMERRLQRAYERKPESIAELSDRFSGLARLVVPEKSLAELQEEELEYQIEMGRLWHLVPVTVTFPTAVCGWTGGPRGDLYGTSDWDELAKNDHVHEAAHAAGGEAVGRESCPSCLALMPA